MPEPTIEIEWLSRQTIHEMRTAITAIRNDLYAANCLTNRHLIERAMRGLAQLRDRLDLYAHPEQPTGGRDV